MNSYQKQLENYRKKIEISNKCSFKILQPYDHKEGYYGCSRNDTIEGVRFYPNCDCQCMK